MALPQYGLTSNQVFGPYAGQLSNEGDTVRLHNAQDEVKDAVSYSSSFPWAMSANALGAEDEWTGQRSSDFQYRGGSLERVSFAHAPNDPANCGLVAGGGSHAAPHQHRATARASPDCRGVFSCAGQ